MGTLALILNGVVANTIAAQLTTVEGENGAVMVGLDQPDYWNTTYGTGATPPYDCAPIQVDTLSPMPGIGWSYDVSSHTFTSPDATQTVTVP